MTWAFNGTSFAVVSEGTIEPEWFTRKTERVVDAVVGGSVVYVDIGATIYEPMSLTAQLTSTATRTTLENLIGTVGVLSDDTGRTCYALLAQVQPVRVKNATSGIYRLALQFEWARSG